jgi:electron transfer flavoprotein alpha subunit
VLSGPDGILSVRLNAVTAEAAGSEGSVEPRAAADAPAAPAAAVLDRVAEAGAEASLEEARIVVVGGRGVASAEGFAIVQDIAAELGGVVGATRASVDAGWIPYARQIGQTGKVVKPALYLGLGVSGAMQHRVGMQSAESIVVVNRDPDAPIGEVADLFVVGDLFEVGPALLAELRARRGG